VTFFETQCKSGCTQLAQSKIERYHKRKQ